MSSALEIAVDRLLGAGVGREAEMRETPPPRGYLNEEQCRILDVALGGNYTKGRLEAAGVSKGKIEALWAKTADPVSYGDALAKVLDLGERARMEGSPLVRAGTSTTITPAIIGSRWTTFTEAQLRSSPPRQEFLWDGLIPARKVGVLVGAGGTGKTSLTVGLAASRALGTAYLGRPVTLGETVIVSTEDSAEDYWRRFRALRDVTPSLDVASLAARIHVVDLSGTGFQLVEGRSGGFAVSRDAEALIEQVGVRAPKADLICFETASRLGGDESNPAMSTLIMAGERIGEARQASILFVAHVSKEAARNGYTDAHAARGGSSISDNARYVLTLAAAKPQGGAGLTLSLSKGNFAAPTGPVALACTSTSWGPVIRLREGDAEDLAANEEDERKRLGLRLREVVSDLTAQGVTVTPTKLREDYAKRVGIAKNRIADAVSRALVDLYLTKRPRDERGGGDQLLPGPNAEPARTRPDEYPSSQPGTEGRGGAGFNPPTPPVLRGGFLLAANEPMDPGMSPKPPELAREADGPTGRVRRLLAASPGLSTEEIASRLQMEESEALLILSAIEEAGELCGDDRAWSLRLPEGSRS